MGLKGHEGLDAGHNQADVASASGVIVHMSSPA